ncbi:MAG: sigma-70 family RNA polymerase sigma factor [Massiliimalia sp.]|jgi:RNA polymerase sporulation-specific sigma factor
MNNSQHQNQSQITDEALVSQYHAGDNDGLVQLIARYLGVIDAKLKSRPYPFGDEEDLKQEALIGLLQAVRTYQPEKGAKFATYADRCIGNAVRNAMMKISAKKIRFLWEMVPIEHAENAEGMDLSENNNPEQIYIDQEQYLQLLKKIEQELSDFEKSVLFYYLDGKSYNQIAVMLTSTPKSVDNALQRIRRKLKTVFDK